MTGNPRKAVSDEQLRALVNRTNAENRKLRDHALASQTLAHSAAKEVRELRARVEVVSEPSVYGRHSGNSYFLDFLREKLRRGGNVPGAAERLSRHEAELAVELPKRREARERAARADYDRAFSTRADRAVLDRIAAFEQRAVTRTDGAGGFFVPPLWLVDESVTAIRAGRPFADLWTSMTLPSGTDSINVPRAVVGTSTGQQVADIAPFVSRDIQDSFVSAPVRTLLGSVDVPLVWVDMGGPVGTDEIIFRDMLDDLSAQLDGQLLLGSGTGGQLAGVWPAGAVSTASGVLVSNTNNANTSAQSWANGGTAASFNPAGSVYQTAAQLLGQMGAARALAPTHWVWHPRLWASLTGAFDGSGRPLVAPHGNVPNEAESSGYAGSCHGLPVVLDGNIPTSFGGTLQPFLSAASNGQYPANPGAGANAVYTPLLAVRAPDLYLWEGELRTRTMPQVVSSAGLARLQMMQYVAALANRYQPASPSTLSGTYVSGGWAAGASASVGTMRQEQANGILNLTAQGY